MIKAIFYDLDGTLRTSQPQGREIFLAYTAQNLGIQIDDMLDRQVLRWEHYYWAQAPELLADQVDFPERDAFWVQYSRRQLQILGLEPAHAHEFAPLVSAHMAEAYRPNDVLLPDTRDTLQCLQEAGYRMAVLSNRDHSFDHHLESLGILHYFEFTLAAGDIQCYKPNPGFFQHALQRAGVAPQEAIYVGDNFYADCIGARKAGLHPVLIDPQKTFPEADCPVIDTLAELPGLVAQAGII